MLGGRSRCHHHCSVHSSVILAFTAFQWNGAKYARARDEYPPSTPQVGGAIGAERPVVNHGDASTGPPSMDTGWDLGQNRIVGCVARPASRSRRYALLGQGRYNDDQRQARPMVGGTRVDVKWLLLDVLDIAFEVDVGDIFLSAKIFPPGANVVERECLPAVELEN